MTKPVCLTDFERDVLISLVQTALSAWEGNEERQKAAARAVQKMKDVDKMSGG